MRTKLPLLFLLTFLPACANFEATTDRLSLISQQLADTRVRLDEIGTDHPASAKVASGLSEAIKGLEVVGRELSQGIASVEGTRSKVGVGMQIGGDVLGGPFGLLLASLGSAIAGGGVVGGVARNTRRQKEASHNHGTETTMMAAVKAAVDIVNANKGNGSAA